MKNINDLFLRIVVITNNRYKAREIIDAISEKYDLRCMCHCYNNMYRYGESMSVEWMHPVEDFFRGKYFNVAFIDNNISIKIVEAIKAILIHGTTEIVYFNEPAEILV